MVAGDAVLIQAKGATTTYQPAAGVEVMLTDCYSETARQTFWDWDGVTNGTAQATSAAGIRGAGSMMKKWINNTYYIRLNSGAGENAMLVGIQTK